MSDSTAAHDLGSRWFGSSVLAASDESFGLKENLLVPAAAAFEPGHYDHRGEIVDGWETRRRRAPGHDWVLIRLGAPGRIREIDVDTSFFTGNFPARCWIQACSAEGYPSPGELLADESAWVEIVGRTELAGDAHNRLAVSDHRRFTHLLVNVDPDGGVARVRVHGEVVPDPADWDGLTVEVSGAEHGGRVIRSSDDFYTPAQVLIMPHQARTMGEGWETRRRRDDGHDSAVIALATSADLQVVEIDTAHFKYNASAAIELFGVSEAEFAAVRGDLDSVAGWRALLPRTRLQPDTRHRFRLREAAGIAIVRVEAYPDGGLSRVRLFGTPTPAGRARAQATYDAATQPTKPTERLLQ
jgi:allantoicase